MFLPSFPQVWYHDYHLIVILSILMCLRIRILINPVYAYHLKNVAFFSRNIKKSNVRISIPEYMKLLFIEQIFYILTMYQELVEGDTAVKLTDKVFALA